MRTYDRIERSVHKSHSTLPYRGKYTPPSLFNHFRGGEHTPFFDTQMNADSSLADSTPLHDTPSTHDVTPPSAFANIRCPFEYCPALKINTIALSADGKHCLLTLRQNKIEVFNTETGKQIHLFPLKDAPVNAVFSRCGAFIYVISTETITALDATLGTVVHTECISGVRASVFATDRHLIAASDAVLLYSKDLQKTATLCHDGMKFTDFTASPCGKRVVTYNTATAQIFDTEEEGGVIVMQMPHCPFSVAISPCLQYFAVSSKCGVALYSMEVGSDNTAVRSYDEDASGRVCFTRCGRYLVHYKLNGGKMHQHCVSSGALVHAIPDAVEKSFVLSPCSRALLCDGSKQGRSSGRDRAAAYARPGGRAGQGGGGGQSQGQVSIKRLYQEE